MRYPYDAAYRSVTRACRPLLLSGAAVIVSCGGVARAQPAAAPGDTAAAVPGTVPDASIAPATPSTLAAAASPADEAGKIGDIVVTATRRETRLQTTPVAITALNEVAIDKLGIQHVDDLAKFVPGLTVPGPTFNGIAAPTIRGIGFLSALSSVSQPVAFYVDGQFMDRPYGVYAKLFDVDRVEVLRGPQGVLFGRNATAGAIRIEHSLPGDTLAVLGRLSYSSFDTVEAQGSIRGPVSDTISLGIAGDYSSSDGYGRNVFNGDHIDGFDVRGVRGSLVWRPNDLARLVLRGAHTYERSTVGYKNIIRFANEHQAIYDDPALGPNDVSNDFPGFNKRISNEVTAEFSYKFPVFTLTALGGYNDYRYRAQTDYDGSPARGGENDYRATYEGYSGELRASSTSLSRARIDVGLYYLHEEPAGDGSSLRIFAPTGVRISGYDGTQELSTTNAYAVFGHAAYDLTDRLTVQAGVRYSSEKKRYQVSARIFAPVVPGGSFLTHIDNSKRWNSVTPLFGIDYKVSDGVFAYATASRGFKSGGFNFPDGAPFNPESVWNYELGLKTDFADRRVRLNLAGFYDNYTDLQVALNLPPPLLVSTRNAATAKIYGIEAEATVVPVERLRLNGSLAWLHARYDDYQFSPTVNLAGQQLPRAPTWKGSAVVEYSIPVALGSLTFQGSYTYEGRISFESIPEPERSLYYLRPISTSLDARVELGVGKQWKVAVFGRNLADRRFYASVVRLGGGSLADAVVNAPRSFGVEVNFRY